MTNSALARRSRFIALVAVPAMLAGCTAIDMPQQPQPRSAAAGQPRLASYACTGGGKLQIESAGGMVRLALVEADGEAHDPVELPAAPPGQSTRFGKEGYALVVEGREALYMKAGRTPLTCTR